jgi:hypothetical protein
MSDKFTMGLQISAVPEFGGLTTTTGSDNFLKSTKMSILEETDE